MVSKALAGIRPTPAIIHAIGGAVLAAAGVGFYFAFYAPAAADIAQRTERMERIHLLMGASEKIAREYHELHDRLDQLRAGVASTRKRMPRRPSTEEFIDAIAQLAAANNLEVKLCSAAAPQVLETHTRVEVTCDLAGSFAGACGFLADVDHLAQISKVSLLSLDTTENSDEYPVSVKFQLYYRPQLSDTKSQ